MWTPITDCGKQLTIHSKVREIDDSNIKEYDIIEVEFDQYKLKLIQRDEPPLEKEALVLTCDQLIQFHFEVDAIDTRIS